jgi:hypothetical protein
VHVNRSSFSLTHEQYYYYQVEPLCVNCMWIKEAQIGWDNKDYNDTALLEQNHECEYDLESRRLINLETIQSLSQFTFFFFRQLAKEHQVHLEGIFTKTDNNILLSGAVRLSAVMKLYIKCS